MLDRHPSRRLAAFHDRNLSAPDARSIETHLAACKDCRAELEDIEFTARVFRQLPVVSAPDHVWAAIETTLSQPQARELTPLLIFRFAAVMIVLGVFTAGWYWLRPPELHWQVERLAGAPTIESRAFSQIGRIVTGESLETDAASRARIQIGEIGSVDVEPETRLDVLETAASDHRLALRSGRIRARILAPPRLFFVETASGTAVDLGCEYSLQCDRAGFATLHVTAGWVSFEWQGRESLVPAGAICRAQPRIGPGTPYFEDAPDNLVAALASLDFANGGRGALRAILSEARTRDTLTLWHLLSRADEAERLEVYERMAELSPLPENISREQILRLDPSALTRWREELAWIW